MQSTIPKYPSASLRPCRCSALYWIPSPLEYGLPRWHLEADHQPLIKKSCRIPLLPGEVIAEIVSHVSDEKTLKACARTAKAFTYQAYKNLYEVVPLCFPNRRTSWEKTPRQLLRLLKKSPHIASLIRGLVVDVGVDHKRDDPDSEYWIYDEEGRRNLHRVVALLGNLRSLRFPRFGVHYKNRASKKTNTPFFPPLSKEQATNLVELDISALTDEQFPPFDCLATLTNVRTLTTDFLFEGTNLLSKYYWIPPLRNLALYGQFDIQISVTLLLAPMFPLKLECDNLRTLEIEQRDRYMVYLDDSGNPRDLTCLNVLLALFRNIKEFRFGPCSCTEYSMRTRERFTVYHELAAPPDVSSLLSLETIVLEGVVEALDPTGRVPEGHVAEKFYLVACPIQWIVDLFQKVSCPSPIREVELRFQVVFRTSCKRKLLEVLFSLWGDLADVLLSWRFPRLRKVKISVDVLATFGSDFEAFRQVDAYPGLRRLKQAGLLVLEI